MRESAGRVGVVTGAASGIGRGIAMRFAREGMKVVFADVDKAPLDYAVDELKSTGVEAVGVVTDVTKRADVERLATATMDTFGAVHVVCNNAGVETGGSFERIPESSWRRVFDVKWSRVLRCLAGGPPRRVLCTRAESRVRAE